MRSIKLTFLENLDRKLIYTSLLIVVALAILDNWTLAGIQSLAVGLVILFIVLGNLGFAYSRRRK